MVKMVSSLGIDWAVMVPPCSLRICLERLSPMPEPLRLVVKKGMNILSITSSRIPCPLSITWMVGLPRLL